MYIDTALFLAGAVVSAEYFQGEVKEKVNEFYNRIDWNAYVDQSNKQFNMSMKPLQGFQSHWDFYAEQLIMYVLGAGSAEKPLDPTVYYRFRRERGSYADGNEFVYSWHGALFTYQYSHAFVDFRGKVDELGMDWFQNSIDATIANHKYSLDQADKFKTFADGGWGLSASDTPTGYTGTAGSFPNGANNTMNTVDGTANVSASLASIVFQPELAFESIKRLSAKEELKGEYGFNNAYNLDEGWFASDAIGIEKGITAIMIENYQSGLIWKLFMQNEQVQNGLKVLGFTEKEVDYGLGY